MPSRGGSKKLRQSTEHSRKSTYVRQQSRSDANKKRRAEKWERNRERWSKDEAYQHKQAERLRRIKDARLGKDVQAGGEGTKTSSDK